MRPYSRALVALGWTLPLFSQTIVAGIKAGVPTTDYFETGASGSLHGSASYSSATRRYTVGRSLEWRRLKALGFEVDAMYHRMGYLGNVEYFDSANGMFNKSTINVKRDSWDFPLLAKYRFTHGPHPYIAGGGVLRYIGPVHGHGEQTSGTLGFGGTTVPLDTSAPSELRKRFYPGITCAGGMEFRAGRLLILPELRYTRWTANIAGPGGVLRFNPNQLEVLGVPVIDSARFMRPTSQTAIPA